MRWLLASSLLWLATTAQARELQGVVSSVNGNTVTFREAASDLTISLDKLTPAAITQITSPEAKEKIQKINVPDEAITATKEKPFGIRGDCSELPMSIDELKKIANDPKVKNIEDLLRAMPKGTMESFTFVTNSLSAQRGTGDTMVSEMYPRVLRTTMDGKLTMSYTCDPKSETYNHVEVFYFDEEEEKFKTTSIKLNKAPGEGPFSRIHQSPKSCVECHSTGKPINGEVSLKPNWQGYFVWGDCDRRRGITVYGMNDDNMSEGAYRSSYRSLCSDSEDQKAHRDSVKDYKKFRELQKDNPCYSLLPWPKEEKRNGSPWNVSMYPYATESQKRERTETGFNQNYSLRTNLRFTDVYSHWMAKRNYGLLRNHHDYEKVKGYLALEAGGCLTSYDTKAIKDLLPGINFERPSTDSRPNAMDPRTAPLLYAFGERVGLQPADWTMEYRETKNPNYVSAMVRQTGSGEGDAGIKEALQTEVLKEQGRDNAETGKLLQGRFSRGVTDLFGSDFSCIDDKLGGFLMPDSPGGYGGYSSGPKGGAKLCAQLRAQNDKHLKDIAARPELTLDELKVICKKEIDEALTPFVDTLAKIREELVGNDTPLLRASIERGRNLVQHGKGQCIKCHSATDDNVSRRPANFLFVPNEKLDAETQAQSAAILQNRMKEGFASEIEDQLMMGMPPIDGVTLSNEEQRDIVNYMKSVAIAPPKKTE